MKTFVIAVQILYYWSALRAEKKSYLQIPDGFLIGSSTSAYQVEGAWNVSDKSESIWDRWVHTNASFWGNGDTGDIAADFYHKYKEDVQIMKDIGLNHFRFSISWSRVMPTGSPDQLSKDGIQYYNNLIDELFANGIEPFVTMHHFDDVQALIERTGGWNNASMIEYFAEYARFLYREFGTKVKFWTTINEMDIFCTFVSNGNEIELGTPYAGRYSCVHNLLKAHARAYHIYNDEFRQVQGGQVGLIVHSPNYIAKSPNDRESAEIAFDFRTGWIMHPVFSEKGDYPKMMKRRIADTSEAEGLTYSRLPEFSVEWVNYIKGSADYVGLIHYITYLVEPVPKIHGRWVNDSGVKQSYDPEWKTTSAYHSAYNSMNRSVVPAGLRALLKQIKETYDNPLIHILENGIAENTTYFDTDRISYLYSFIKEVLEAIREGCNVKSYAIWSLLDNFEWDRGYSNRFGIVHVNYTDPNRMRTPKLSSYWLKAVLEKRVLIPFSP